MIELLFCMKFDLLELTPNFFPPDSQMMLSVADFYFPTFISNSHTFQTLLHRFYLQPEVYRRCQREVDEVVGQSRLPRLDDRIK